MFQNPFKEVNKTQYSIILNISSKLRTTCNFMLKRDEQYLELKKKTLMELTDSFHRRKDPDNKAIEIIQTEMQTDSTYQENNRDSDSMTSGKKRTSLINRYNCGP